MTEDADPAPPRPDPHPTVLQSIAKLTGEVPKVLLPDAGSEGGASPILDPGSPEKGTVARQRGNYQIMGEIARGGMALILKGHDTDLGRDVAVKVLDEELAKNPAVVQRFVEEAQIGGQLQHPGIVPVYELGLMADERPYFTMKLIKGRTLSELLQRRKSPQEDRSRILAVFESVCQTVAYAHSKSVLHRDLKPSNIMVGAFGEVQVVDWGLAKVLRRGGVEDERRAKREFLTVIETVRSGPGSTGSDSMVGSVMGTPAYMAPEQAQGEIEKLDERADVFSLGAILCEILTGKPPYLGEDNESTVVQAARAELDPARERIEACDADGALKKLCLDCLTPARVARPRNADEVAGAIHDYLSTVEERARAAEIAATEARLKAEQERRARRLTIALAGSIMATVLFGGAGLYLLEQQRQERMERTRLAINDAHAESIELGQRGRFAEAVQAARQALLLTETEEVDAALAERAERFVAQAEAALTAAEREREQQRRDAALVEQLEGLRLAGVDAIGDRREREQLDQAFATAFRDYGVDLQADDLLPALKHIRQRELPEAVAIALDDWAKLLRSLHGGVSEESRRLTELAFDLDPDPDRNRMREALLQRDIDTLLTLAEPEVLPRLHPGSIWVLAATLWDMGRQHRPVCFRIYDQALHLYPDDFILQATAGIIYQDVGRMDSAIACFTAAESLRPDNAGFRYRMGNVLLMAGRHTDAVGAYRAAIALEPDNPDYHLELGQSLMSLGHYRDAIPAYERSLALEDREVTRVERLVADFYVGEASREDIHARIAETASPQDRAVLAWALLDHPDPAQRDPEGALHVTEQLLHERPVYPAYFRVHATALAGVGAFEEAAALLRGKFEYGNFGVASPGTHEFVRAVIFAGMGHDDEAIDAYARGSKIWSEVTGGEVASWEHSYLSRWRRRAEEAMGR